MPKGLEKVVDREAGTVDLAGFIPKGYRDP